MDPVRWTTAPVKWISGAADEIAGEYMVSARQVGEVRRGGVGGCSGRCGDPGGERVPWGEGVGSRGREEMRGGDW